LLSSFAETVFANFLVTDKYRCMTDVCMRKYVCKLNLELKLDLF